MQKCRQEFQYIGNTNNVNVEMALRFIYTLTPAAYGGAKQCGESATSLNSTLPTIPLVR